MTTLVAAETVDMAALAKQIMALPPVRIVAVDGGAASGKTSFAERLGAALPAPVLHTDLLLDGWAGQFTFWDRLRAGILAPLRRGRPGSYERYDWLRGEFARTVEIPPTDTLVVDGVSSITACGDAASFRIFLDVPRAERERRWAERDGEPLQPEWISWLDAEDVFFAAQPPEVDLVVSGRAAGISSPPQAS